MNKGVCLCVYLGIVEYLVVLECAQFSHVSAHGGLGRLRLLILGPSQQRVSRLCLRQSGQIVTLTLTVTMVDTATSVVVGYFDCGCCCIDGKG